MPFVGNRDFAVRVVGESFYDDNLRELCGAAEDHMSSSRRPPSSRWRMTTLTTGTPFALMWTA